MTTTREIWLKKSAELNAAHIASIIKWQQAGRPSDSQVRKEMDAANQALQNHFNSLLSPFYRPAGANRAAPEGKVS